jgi:hypothetical protein
LRYLLDLKIHYWLIKNWFNLPAYLILDKYQKVVVSRARWETRSVFHGERRERPEPVVNWRTVSEANGCPSGFSLWAGQFSTGEAAPTTCIEKYLKRILERDYLVPKSIVVNTNGRNAYERFSATFL